MTKNGCSYCAYCSRTYCVEIGLRIALEQIREIEGDAHPQPPGDCPGSVRPNCAIAQTNSIACTTSIAARNATKPNATRQ